MKIKKPSYLRIFCCIEEKQRADGRNDTGQTSEALFPAGTHFALFQIKVDVEELQLVSQHPVVHWRVLRLAPVMRALNFRQSVLGSKHRLIILQGGTGRVFGTCEHLGRLVASLEFVDARVRALHPVVDALELRFVFGDALVDSVEDVVGDLAEVVQAVGYLVDRLLAS